LPDRVEEGADDGLGFRRLAGNQLFGDLQRHAVMLGKSSRLARPIPQEPHPGRGRLPEQVVATFFGEENHCNGTFGG
jgi:hypothetical protein